MEKLIIIGSGPAGYTAAIYTSRALLKPLMFEGDQPGGQLTTTTEVENFPGFEHGIQGPELMEILKKQALRFGTRIESNSVTKVDFSKRPFKVWVGEKVYEANSVIVSTGASAKRLGIESEKKFNGRGVSACATCDGAFFRNQEVLVVGGGDTAVEEATFLTRFASKVWIVHRRNELRASKIMADRAKANPKIGFYWDSEIHEIRGEKTVNSVILKSTKTGELREVNCQGVFVAIGHQPNTDIFKGHLEMESTGYLKTRPGTSYTSVEGVFAAGDVQDHVYRQAITAAGSGCMAAIDAERWLEKQGQ